MKTVLSKDSIAIVFDRLEKGLVLTLIVILSIVIAACQPTNINPNTTPTPSSITATPTDIWKTLLQHTPVPWTTPLPAEEPTIIDATYVKTNPRIATPFPCARCPDYALEGGVWKFQFDKGVFRIYHALSGWRSLGSYTVSEDRLYLFNDPYCSRDTGIYTWQLEGGTLSLTEVDDPCSQGLRAANLIDQPWLSCRPPNKEAAITDHWQKPAGCDPDDSQ